MPAWQGKSKGTLLGYRIFVAVLKKFGVTPAYFILRFVAFHYFLFSYKSSKSTYHYFHNKLGYGILKSLLKVYQNYLYFGESIIDKVVVMSGIPNKFTYNFDGEENLRKIVGLQKGGLLLSSHIGNWEIAGHLLNRLNTRINVVMYDGEHQQIKKYITSVTGERNMNVIVIKNDLSHVYKINDALKNNELICMHSDRFIEGNKTITADFLGDKARFPAGPFILAASFKVPLAFVFALKETNFHYHFFASELKEYGHLEKAAGMQEMLNDFVGAIESKVKQYPEQWYNYYNFWQQ
jgi:predicted LPLAT superfamily acyltransferase